MDLIDLRNMYLVDHMVSGLVEHMGIVEIRSHLLLALTFST